jgi:hypothetical protein
MGELGHCGRGCGWQGRRRIRRARRGAGDGWSGRVGAGPTRASGGQLCGRRELGGDELGVEGGGRRGRPRWWEGEIWHVQRRGRTGGGEGGDDRGCRGGGRVFLEEFLVYVDRVEAFGVGDGEGGRGRGVIRGGVGGLCAGGDHTVMRGCEGMGHTRARAGRWLSGAGGWLPMYARDEFGARCRSNCTLSFFGRLHRIVLHRAHRLLLRAQPPHLPLQPAMDRHLNLQDARQQLGPPRLKRRQLCTIARLNRALATNLRNNPRPTCELLRSLFTAIVSSFISSSAVSDCFAVSSSR